MKLCKVESMYQLGWYFGRAAKRVVIMLSENQHIVSQNVTHTPINLCDDTETLILRKFSVHSINLHNINGYHLNTCKYNYLYVAAIVQCIGIVVVCIRNGVDLAVKGEIGWVQREHQIPLSTYANNLCDVMQKR